MFADDLIHNRSPNIREQIQLRRITFRLSDVKDRLMHSAFFEPFCSDDEQPNVARLKNIAEAFALSKLLIEDNDSSNRRRLVWMLSKASSPRVLNTMWMSHVRWITTGRQG